MVYRVFIAAYYTEHGKIFQTGRFYKDLNDLPITAELIPLNSKYFYPMLWKKRFFPSSPKVKISSFQWSETIV